MGRHFLSGTEFLEASTSWVPGTLLALNQGSLLLIGMSPLTIERDSRHPFLSSKEGMLVGFLTGH